MAKGIPLEGDQVPVSDTECAFGKWLYSEEEKVKSAIGSVQFSEIEAMHMEWHEEYMKIYDIYYGKGKKGLFGKLIGGRPKLSEKDRERAKAYLEDLKSVTWSLTKQLDGIEKRIESMPPDCC